MMFTLRNRVHFCDIQTYQIAGSYAFAVIIALILLGIVRVLKDRWHGCLWLSGWQVDGQPEYCCTIPE